VADDPNAALRAELEAAKAVLDEQIRGLQKMANDPLSAALLGEINGQIAERQQRVDLIDAALRQMDLVTDALNALYADGYPAMPQEELPPELAAELKGEVSDIEAGANVFTTTGATSLTIDLGAPQSKE
jgi:uncharacterized coiled-coil protein SlyX